FWTGVLAANGRINPRTFQQDPAERALIDVIGIGFPPRAPQHEPMLRGVHPLFPNDARIVLWGGGIWDWLDPLTLIRAWRQVIARHPEARLVFLGTRHPNPLVPPHKLAEQAVAFASEIGEKDRTIFFYEWLPYAEREALLCEADVGITLHPLHIETRYSIRTRVLDYLWARLPVLVSDGDVTSEWVRQYGVGQVVPPLDVEAVVRALIEMLDKPKDTWQPAFTPLPEIFNWSRVVEPLRRYCLYGTYAPDRQTRTSISTETATAQNWRTRLARASYIWRTQGLRLLLHRVWRFVQWRLAQPFSK
ncbi:MAG TPA: glycosyltransferase, partial [Anaerolineae bacterium]